MVTNVTTLDSLGYSQETGLEQVLLDMGVKPSHVKIALKRSEDTGEPLTDIMRDFGFLSPEQVAEAISKFTGMAYFPPSQMDELSHAKLEGIELKQFKGFVPVGFSDKGEFTLLVPDSTMASEAGKQFFDFPKQLIMVASENTIQAIYRKFYAQTEKQFDDAVSAFVSVIESKSKEEDPSLIRDIFCTLIRHTCYSGASDLYIYKSESVGIIKLKVNGSGIIFRCVPLVVYDRLMNKLISENTKAEDLKKEPKEATVSFENEEDKKRMADILVRYGFRLELAETRDQRTAVIRILDNQSSATELSKLGFDPVTLSKIKRITHTNTGLFIVTGPTGSGKTTTLYASLKSIDPVEKSIQSIENPKEYTHGLWMQYEMRKDTVNEAEEANKWLKALLRNAPDVILMGEVRDAGIASILLDAANTGHLVFTTLHTNDATLAVARLKQLGVDMNSLAAVLLGVLAQRLVRVLCPKCKVLDYRAETFEVLEEAYLDHLPHKVPFKAGDGCKHCDNTGYKSRTMIYELLDVNIDVRVLIEKGASPSEIAKLGIPYGSSMWASCVKLVAQGITSYEELIKSAKKD